MTQIIQALFFLNKFERDDICEPKTNKMSWKKAKEILEIELPERMTEYKVYGEKTEEFKPYQTINYCEKIIAGFTQEEVDAYHADMGKIFRWLKMAVDTRKQDVIRRKAIHKFNREVKTQREEQKQAREVAREQFLTDKETEFNEANKEDIEAYNRWKEEQERIAEQDYGEEAGTEDEDEKANQEPPYLPTWDKEEAE
mmetsp:Transcript_26429/g.35322  ORF Transcript_26429/g.35322 Transcript_26429/m.35322 type:complete len:198 (+) Transcript_26429:1226-1819(+)